MKAIVYQQYGSPDVLKFNEVAKPIPKDDEVLTKVYATSANAGDWHLMRGTPFLVRLMFGLRKPKFDILGTDVAGRVEAVGKDVRQLKVGDEVFGDLTNSGFGAFAEYVAASEDSVVVKPDGITFEQSAAVPVAAVTALQGLRDHGQIQAGHKVLINGASGSVGMYAVQLAKSFGAEVAGVSSARKMELVRSAGADHVIDYAQVDFTKNAQQYDLILDTAASHSIFAYKRALSPDGVYVMVGGPVARLFQTMLLGPLVTLRSRKKMKMMLVNPNQADLLVVKGLLETEKIAPIIDKHYPLNDVPDAIRYLENGRAQGKVVITVAHHQ